MFRGGRPRERRDLDYNKRCKEAIRSMDGEGWESGRIMTIIRSLEMVLNTLSVIMSHGKSPSGG